MIEIHRILCPTDFSEFSARALHQAIPLARWYEASLHALHVVPGAVPVDGMFPSSMRPLEHPGVASHLQAALEEFVAPARAAGIPVEVTLREGGATREILDLARTLPADLLVMGTHGYGGFEHWVLGSVTEKVLRKAACPVLTVSREERAFSGPAPFKRILCATDFSPAAAHALDYALSLAEEAAGTLILVHVLEGLPVEEIRKRVGFEVPDFRAALAADALRRLRAAVPAPARDWCQTEETVVHGRAPEQIVTLAREREAQLVVLGVHGRSALDLMFFGSTAHRVVREAPCPVLTIRAPEAAAARAAAGGGR